MQLEFISCMLNCVCSFLIFYFYDSYRIYAQLATFRNIVFIFRSMILGRNASLSAGFLREAVMVVLAGMFWMNEPLRCSMVVSSERLIR